MEERSSKELLEENLVSVLNELNLDSEDYKDKAETIAKLYKLKIEEWRVELEAKDKADRLKFEKEQKNQEEFNQQDQITRDEKERWWRRGLEIAGIVVPIAFYGVWMKKGFKFEETGTITSSTFRGLTKFFRPTKK